MRNLDLAGLLPCSLLGLLLAVAACAPGSGAPSERTRDLGPGPLFTAQDPWNDDVSTLPPSESSSAITAWLRDHGGFGSGAFRVDFSLTVLTADATTPRRPFVATSQFYVPDCDHVPIPVPSNGALEGESGYRCDHDGDCHLLVVDPASSRLFELWRADISPAGAFTGGCAAVWQLDRSYPPNLRGDGCTSADAGGFPISALLATADEVAAGEIRHALRLILPNDRIRAGVYVHPGTHSTAPTRGGADAPPYGVRMRLRESFPLGQLSSGAQVIARAMQRYGLFLVDGGTIALTVASDRFASHAWKDLGVDERSLTSITPTDLEVVAMGEPIEYTGNCVRNPM